MKYGKINLRAANEIRVKYRTGDYKMRELAIEYNTTISKVSDIVNNKTLNEDNHYYYN